MSSPETVVSPETGGSDTTSSTVVAPTPPSPADMPRTDPAQTAVEPEPAEDKTAAELAKIRKEAASWRTKFREQETAAAAATKAAQERETESASLKDVLAKLNAVLNPDANTPPDPAKLAEQLAAAQAETAKVQAEKDRQIRDLTVKAALPTALTKHQADPGLTEAVLVASGALGKLDPSSDSFAADLASAVAAAVEANPRLKVSPPEGPRSSGPPIPGRSGGSDQLTLEQVRSMSSAQIDKARKAGQLRNLGIGPG